MESAGVVSEGQLLDWIVPALLAFVIYELHQARKQAPDQAAAFAAIVTRLTAAEAWISKHDEIKEAVRGLTEQMKSVFNQLSDIADHLEPAYGYERGYDAAPRRRNPPRRRASKASDRPRRNRA